MERLEELLVDARTEMDRVAQDRLLWDGYIIVNSVAGEPSDWNYLWRMGWRAVLSMKGAQE